MIRARVVFACSEPRCFETASAPGSISTISRWLRALERSRKIRGCFVASITLLKIQNVCSHPRSLPPLPAGGGARLLGNYYFGKLGEQLPESTFNSTLAEFGFGQATKINPIGVPEAAGKLPYGQWRAETALGEGEQIQVTPIQLLTAYSALVNGGHLLVPQIAPEAGFVAQHRESS